MGIRLLFFLRIKRFYYGQKKHLANDFYWLLPYFCYFYNYDMLITDYSRVKNKI